MESPPERRRLKDRRTQERRQPLASGMHLHLGAILVVDRRTSERREGERRNSLTTP